MRNRSFDGTPFLIKKMNTDINGEHNKSFTKINIKNEKQKNTLPYNKPNHNKRNKYKLLIPKNKFIYQQCDIKLIDSLKNIINNNNISKFSTINNSFNDSLNNKLLLHNNSVILYKKKPTNNNAKTKDILNSNKKEKIKNIFKKEEQFEKINKNTIINKNQNTEKYDEKKKKLFARMKQSNYYLKNVNYKYDYLIYSPQETNKSKYNNLLQNDNKIKNKVKNSKMCRITKLNRYSIKLPKINSIEFSKQTIKIYKLNTSTTCYFSKKFIKTYKLSKIDVCYFSKNYITPQLIIKLPKINKCYFNRIKVNTKEDHNNSIFLRQINIRRKKIADAYGEKNRNKKNKILVNNTLELDAHISVRNKMSRIYHKKCNTYKKEMKKNNTNTSINDYKVFSSDKFNIINQSLLIYRNNINPMMVNKEKKVSYDNIKNLKKNEISPINKNNESIKLRLDQLMINDNNEENKDDNIINPLIKTKKDLENKIEDDDNNPSKEETKNFSDSSNSDNNNIIAILKKDIDTFSKFLISNEIYSKSDLLNKKNIKYKWSKTIISLGNNSLDEIIKTFIKICIDNINDENKNDIMFIFNEYIKNIIEYYIENINDVELNNLHDKIKVMLKEILVDINNIMLEILGTILFILIENKLYYLMDINDLIKADKDSQIVIANIIKYVLLSSGDKIKKYFNDFNNIIFYDKDIFNDYVINNVEIISQLK
jgi:hypothetical protein